jgi:hypothetical protein
MDMCSGSGYLFVFERSSSSAAWKVDLEPNVNLNAVPKLATTSTGYETLVTSGKGLRTNPASIPATLANELSSYVTSGNLTNLPNTIFGAKGQCWSITNFRTGFETASTAGQSPTYQLVPYTPSDLVAFRTANGGALALFSVEATLTATAPAGDYLSQAPTPGQPSSYVIPAGQYSSDTQAYLLELAVVIPPAKSRGSAPFEVIRAYGGSLVGSGVPYNGS